MTQLFTLRTGNRPGVLARLSGILAAQGCNIACASAAPGEDNRFSHITLLVDADERQCNLIARQMRRIPSVLEIHVEIQALQ